ncbi:FxSxx-COOH system tetratricopeptide repeat protein [Actinomadura sp. 9N215]|uniref:FxSxx-COOH system tetratricopeptide repeat protein n=1 Tax=Actinomadura sp. 9N215 TaxID=3375150 RepID=UPI0037916BF9
MSLPPAALHRAIVAVDVAGFGDRRRTNPDRVRARDGLYRALRRSFTRSALPWDTSHREDRGDGALVLVSPEVPKVRLSGSLPQALADALDDHNTASPPAQRIGLRMALHAGEVHHDTHGVAGACVNDAFRLLEAPAVKDVLAGSRAPLVLVVSEWFFEEVVRHDPGSRPDAFRQVRVELKETSTTARVRVVEPGEPLPDVVAGGPATESAGTDDEGPMLFNVPRRNRDFTGREALLDVLAGRLAPGVSGPAPSSCALHGMGGVGKSQIAREFAHRHGARFSGVLWIDAGHPFALVRDLGDVADRLGLPRDDAQRRIVQLWNELAARGRWLLIYDNAENQKDVEAWWPSTDVGVVLVTTRTATWRLADPVQVPPFSRAESIDFLHRTTGGGPRPGQPHRSQAGRVAGELGDLPLALAQAAAYVTRNHTGWERYTDLLRAAPARLLHLNRPDDYPGTAATTWSLSMSRVEEEHPGSIDLLRLCAFVDADRIPRGLVRPGASELPPALRLMAEDPVSYDLTAGALAEYALVDAAPETLSVHPLVQTMIRESLTREERRTWLTVAVRQLALCFPDRPRSPDSWRECIALLPHVAAVARHVRRAPDGPPAPAEAADVCRRAAVHLEARDQYEQALELIDHALAFAAAAFGRDCEQYAETLTVRGEAECYLGHHLTAVATARTALAIRDRLPGADPSAALSTLRLLGRALTEAGRPDDAIAVLDRAATISADVHGTAHPRTAELLARLAYAHWRHGDLELARTTYRRADEAWHAAGSRPDRERTAAARWQAAVLCDLHDHAAAKAVVERAIRMARELYGPGHVETVRAEETLGIVLAASGRPAEGLRLQLRAADFLRAFYPVHVVMASTLTALTRTLLLNDRPADALAVAREALRLYTGRYGTVNHVYTAGALAALGMAQRRLGRTAEAGRHLDQARAIYERAGGPAHLLGAVQAEIKLC